MPNTTNEAWEGVSNEAIGLVTDMLVKNPRRRPSARDLLTNPWFSHHGVVDPSANQVEVVKRLKEFRRAHPLQRAELTRLVRGLPAEELAGLQDLFSAMDLDGDGQVNLEEMRRAIQSRGCRISERELEEVMGWAEGQTRTLSCTEFLAAMTCITSSRQPSLGGASPLVSGYSRRVGAW